MLKRVFAAALTGVLALSLLAGCQPQENTGTGSNASDVSTGSWDGKTLVVGVDDKFAPMGFRDENNEIVGFDIDLAKAAAEHMNCEVEIKAINWNNKTMELNNGNVDVIWNGLTITDERKQDMLFTKPYLANEQVVVVKNDNSEINAISDLADKNVVLQEDSSALEAFQKQEVYNEVANLAKVADNAMGFLEIKNGTSDALVVDSVVAKYYIEKEPDTYRIVGEALAPEEYGIGIKKGNEDLLNKLQAALDTMWEDGTAAEISEKWFGEDLLLRD